MHEFRRGRKLPYAYARDDEYKVMEKKRKPKKCKACGVEYAPFNTLQKACSPECALKLVEIEKEKKEKALTRKMKKEFNENDKGFQKARAQAAFNAFIRYRDVDEGCISCYKPAGWSGRWDAGHYFTVGARPDLRFNEDNCHKQCHYDCNINKSGNIAEYRKGLVNKIGEDRVKALEEHGKTTESLTAEHYKQIAKKYKDKLEKLKRLRGGK